MQAPIQYSCSGGACRLPAIHYHYFYSLWHCYAVWAKITGCVNYTVVRKAQHGGGGRGLRRRRRHKFKLPEISLLHLVFSPCPNRLLSRDE